MNSPFSPKNLSLPNRTARHWLLVFACCLILGLSLGVSTTDASPAIAPQPQDLVSQEPESLLALKSNLEDIDSQLLQLTQELRQLMPALKEAEIALTQGVAAASARLRFLQRQPKSYGLALLMSSQNFKEFRHRRHQLKLIYQADRQALKHLLAKVDQLNGQKINISQKKNQIALIRQEQLGRQLNFQAQGRVQRELIKRLHTNRWALEAAQIQIKKDVANIRKLIGKGLDKAKFALPQGSGFEKMTLPNDGRISSSFGWRKHPIIGNLLLHSGMDFASDYGSIISSADAGIVIFADWYGGYGNTVIIAHSTHVITLYAHASELFVQEGQRVKRGQAIGTVGSTGLATGPHLHFEVRENGLPVDPMNYLS